MASMHVLKPAVAPISTSQSKISGNLSCFSTGKSIFKLQSYGRLRFFGSRRFRVSCRAQDDNGQSNGEEPPESLFMKELRRRGITPTSLLEEFQISDSELEDDIKMEDEQIGSMRNAVSKELRERISDQRDRSMALNSEGLEGLVPRAKLLLTLGATFFWAFWPLILIIVAFFSALYFYFGPTFVHDASKMPVSPPQYIDPYALLEDERISQMARSIN